MNYLKNKQNLLLLMFICLSISAFGQNMYVSANVGYGIGISPLPFNNYAPIKGSLGKGTSINTAFGFVFGKHLGAELNISYLIGEKSGIQTNSTQLNIDNNFSARMLNLMPSLVIRTGEKKMKPYAKFGVVVSRGEILKTFILNNSNPRDPFLFTSKEIFSGGTAFGLHSGVGLNYQLSQSFSIFCEANSINMSYSPTKGLVIETTSNGADLLPQMSKQNKETIFIKEVDSTIIIDENNPKQVLRVSYPFGNIGFHLGTRFEF